MNKKLLAILASVLYSINPSCGMSSNSTENAKLTTEASNNDIYTVEDDIIVNPTNRSKVLEKQIYTTHSVLIEGFDTEQTELVVKNLFSMVGNKDNATTQYPVLFINGNVLAYFQDTLMLKNVMIRMKPYATCDDDKLWYRPMVSILNKLKLEGEIQFKARYDNKILIGNALDVSKLESTQTNFKDYDDYIYFLGMFEDKPAVLIYYNPDDADRIPNILDIKNADATKRNLYIWNIRCRLEKLFVGNKALLRTLRFKNMKIYNYSMGDEKLFTTEITNALEEIRAESAFGLSIEDA